MMSLQNKKSVFIYLFVYKIKVIDDLIRSVSQIKSNMHSEVFRITLYT